MYSNQRSAPSIPAYKYETIINRNFKKSAKGFGSSNSRFYGSKSTENPGPGSYYHSKSVADIRHSRKNSSDLSISKRSVSFSKSKRFKKSQRERLINIGPGSYQM